MQVDSYHPVAAGTKNRGALDVMEDLPDPLDEILASLRRSLTHPLVTSAVLVGSASRGEMAFAEIEGRLHVRSDLELYVICESPMTARKVIEPSICEMERQHAALWPEFHIDIAWMNRDRWRRLEPWVRHFELKANGRILAGRDLLIEVPDVSLENLDWRELNEIVLWRLLGLLARLSTGWLLRRSELPLDGAHSMARSLLDVTTWGLPGLGTMLPSFGARVARWREPDVQGAASSAGLVDGETLKECLRSRRRAQCALPVSRLFPLAARTWMSAYEIATGVKPWPHRGAGLGFRKLGLLRRLRAVKRTCMTKATLAWRTLESGPMATGAAVAYLLADVSLSLFHGVEGDLHERLAEARLALSLKGAEGEPVQHWNEARNALLNYMDGVLGRCEWSRLMPTEDRR